MVFREVRMDALRILLVEPNRHARDLLRLMVEAAYPGVLVTTARTVASGIVMLEETPYDIMICDGCQAVAAVKEVCKEAHCSLVLMTRDTRLKASDLQTLHPNLPAQSLLYKPIMFRDFCQTLHKAVITARRRQAIIFRRRSGRVSLSHGH